MSESLYHPPKFQVGKPHDLNSTDPWFHDERDAIEAAAKLHRESSPFGLEPVGIWDDRSQWVWLFYDNEQFRKV